MHFLFLNISVAYQIEILLRNNTAVTQWLRHILLSYLWFVSLVLHLSNCEHRKSKIWTQIHFVTKDFIDYSCEAPVLHFIQQLVRKSMLHHSDGGANWTCVTDRSPQCSKKRLDGASSWVCWLWVVSKQQWPPAETTAHSLGSTRFLCTENKQWPSVAHTVEMSARQQLQDEKMDWNEVLLNSEDIRTGLGRTESFHHRADCWLPFVQQVNLWRWTFAPRS